MRFLFALGLLAGCAGAGPQDAVTAYAQAVRAGDVDRIWALSDEAFRAAHDREELRAYLAEHQTEALALAEALEVQGSLHAEIRLEGGRRLALVDEGGAWRIAFGGLEPYSAATPESAVQTFFRAVEAGRWRVVRSVMPEAHQAQYREDDALQAHLMQMQPRIEAARGALGAPAPKSAQIEGDRARLTYGSGKAVEFVLEAGRWRILDLE